MNSIPLQHWLRLVLVAVIGAGISLSAYHYSLSLEQELVQREFARLAELRAQRAQEAINQSTEVLQSFKGFFISSQTVERDEFHRFVAAVLQNRPELLAVHWAPRVLDAQRAAVEQDLHGHQRVPLGIFDIAQDARHPVRAPTRPEYFPIVYAEPAGENSMVVGLDVFERPFNQQTIRFSASHDQRAMTPPFVLMQDPEGPRAVAIYQPVFFDGLPLRNEIERWVALRGYVILMVRPNILIDKINADGLPLSMALFDDDQGQHTAIYPVAARLQPDSDHVAHFKLRVPGRQWTLEVQDVPLASHAYPALQPLMLLFALLALTLLLIFLRRSYRDAQALAQANVGLINRQQVLDEMAYSDALTGLPNRYALFEHLEEALRVQRKLHGWLALCVLDLDGFKEINDQFGHQAGDRVLKITAERIQHEVRNGDIAARLGGDEFVILLTHVEQRETAEQIAQRLLQALGKPMQVLGLKEPMQVSSSIGVVWFDQADDAEQVVQQADKAMYRAKENGKDQVVFWGS
ncbi:diguanylate cyclase [Pokkaliibacter sp. MBI-7]|uniref:GGDEF domain-containing protein n=1 Tax=Pokkaliibacter sp. MBI-7 TaxID=3040600 RepID=UPI0024474193|nr:diguanylate cyclase [Pokkaliibacter sp. MBI-7]MDH2433511.1 diguanylate cyclase [Pokkaliibacter sp. MBI-7]